MHAEGELASLFSEAISAGSLDGFSDQERLRITSLCRANMQRFEAMFFRYEAGLLEEKVWEVRRTWLSGFIQLPVIAEWWSDERISSGYTPAFIEDVEGAEGLPLGPTGQRQGRIK